MKESSEYTDRQPLLADDGRCAVSFLLLNLTHGRSRYEGTYARC